VIVASGEAGKSWAQGTQLGEQFATVVVDDVTVTLRGLSTSQPN